MDSQKPIVFLLTQDLSSPSGLGRYFPMAKYIRRSYSAVTILALHSNYADLTPKQDIVEGVKVKYVAQMHVLKRGNTTEYFHPLKLIWISFLATWSLFKACMRENPGLIVIGKPHPMNGLAGFMVRFFQGSKTVVDCDDYEAPSNHYRNKFEKEIVRYFEDNLPKGADLITTNTHFTKNRLIGLGVRSDKIYYVPNGVDLDRFPAAELTKLINLKIDLGLQDHKVIGYIGSLNLASHPVNLLLSSFNEVNRLMPETRLLIVGGGRDLDKLEILSRRLGIDDKVVFTGRIPPEMAYLYYQICDVTVDPVNNDDVAKGRSPLKMVESWACKVPFVSMDVGDRKTLSGDPPSALIIEPNSTLKLAEALIEVLNNDNLSKQLIERGELKAMNYSWESIISQTSLFIKLLFDK